MLERILRWIDERKSTEDNPPPQTSRKAGGHSRSRIARSKSDRRRTDDTKTSNRNKPERKNPVTENDLELLDDTAAKSGEASGIDPYNTGGFDRSKNWESHFRK